MYDFKRVTGAEIHALGYPTTFTFFQFYVLGEPRRGYVLAYTGRTNVRTPWIYNFFALLRCHVTHPAFGQNVAELYVASACLDFLYSTGHTIEIHTLMEDINEAVTDSFYTLANPVFLKRFNMMLKLLLKGGYTNR